MYRSDGSGSDTGTIVANVSYGTVYLKVWWHDATLFVFFIIFYYIHTYIHSFIQSHSFNTFIHRHSRRPLSISSSLVCSVGKHLPVVPRQESNSSLPYSKPTYTVSNATVATDGYDLQANTSGRIHWFCTGVKASNSRELLKCNQPCYEFSTKCHMVAMDCFYLYM